MPAGGSSAKRDDFGAWAESGRGEFSGDVPNNDMDGNMLGGGGFGEPQTKASIRCEIRGGCVAARSELASSWEGK